jgi:sec-independent protein translocase protein TatA
MGGITNPLHLAFIAVIALIFLGPKRLPDLARTLGNGMREFRAAISGESTAESPEPEPSVGIEALAPAAAPVATETAPVPPSSASAPPPGDQVVTAMNAAPSPSEQELAAPPTSTAL